MRISDWSSDVCSSDLHATHQDLGRLQLARRQYGAHLVVLDAGRGDQHPPLRLPIGIADVDLHQEAVELRLGQRVRAFLLQRVLGGEHRSEEHTSELQSLMRISYAVFCLKKKTKKTNTPHQPQ